MENSTKVPQKSTSRIILRSTFLTPEYIFKGNEVNIQNDAYIFMFIVILFIIAKISKI
jgi:hypothetical protein